MKGHPVVRVFWFMVNGLIVAALAAVIFSTTWEFSTRNYLRGFSDAIIPASDNPVQKAEAILSWMEHGPARRTAADPNALDTRDPENTLNYHQLLEVCGTATNAFVNLAQSSGLPARRLLLLDENRLSKHVVVELLVDNRWIIVDPSYHTIFRLPNGQFVTKAELRDPVIFRAVTQSIPNYPQSYTYERTVNVRVGRIPVIGRHLRQILNFVWPPWEEKINWTLVVERESFAMLLVSIFLLCLFLTIRLLLDWFCFHSLGIVRVRLRDQIKRAGDVLLNNIH
jgi:hypothetical protein